MKLIFLTGCPITMKGAPSEIVSALLFKRLNMLTIKFYVSGGGFSE